MDSLEPMEVGVQAAPGLTATTRLGGLLLWRGVAIRLKELLYHGCGQCTMQAGACGVAWAQLTLMSVADANILRQGRVTRTWSTPYNLARATACQLERWEAVQGRSGSHAWLMESVAVLVGSNGGAVKAIEP